MKCKYKFKPLRNLDELRAVNSEEIIGVAQLSSPTIPAKCMMNDKEKMELLGNMDDAVIIRYNFEINDVSDFYPDGSIMFRRNDNNSLFIGPEDEEFEKLRENLIKSNLWENY